MAAIPDYALKGLMPIGVASDVVCDYPLEMELLERITITPDVRSGKPCVSGTRITVYDILEYMAGGMSNAEILVDFPSLSNDDLLAVLAFAAIRERRLSHEAA
jgi:uncharacterized protein (DUF433 family)